MSVNPSLQAQTSQLWHHALDFTKSMSLKCAIELGISETIQNHGKAMTIPELATALSIPQSKTYALSCLMSLLTSSGLFTSTKISQQDAYNLTNTSKLLVRDNSVTPSPFILTILGSIMMSPSSHISSWLRGTSSTPFYMVHGREFWDLADVDSTFNNLFNQAMASDATLVRDVVMARDRGRGLFDGVSSMIDVGGGTGTMAKAIKKEFPAMNCMVLDLQHVVDTVSETGGVEFIGGDMFDKVQHADVVLLKWILHDWSDEHCIKILQCCRDAIPTKKNGGKIIIIDMVVGVTIQDEDVHIPIETQILFDVEMMVLCPGKERTEKEWRKLFNTAGFNEYKITPCVGLRSIIELYK